MFLVFVVLLCTDAFVRKFFCLFGFSVLYVCGFVLVALGFGLVVCMGALLVANVLCGCWWLRFWMFSVTGIIDGRDC